MSPGPLECQVQHLDGSADQIELMRGIELLVGLVQGGVEHGLVANRLA
jgi:hypothetical protein